MIVFLIQLHLDYSSNAIRRSRETHDQVAYQVFAEANGVLRASKGVRGPLVTYQEQGAHSFGSLAAIARAQYRPWREAANPASSQRARGLAL